MLTRKAAVTVFFCQAVLLFCSSCSSGPAPPRMGTPEWYWSAAKEQFAAGDYTKTQEHLGKIMEGDSPLKQRAATWHLVVLAGMARGHKDLARAYDDGEEASKTQATEFRRATSELRRHSRIYSIGLAEEVIRFQKEMGDTAEYTLEFDFPRGSPVEVSTLGLLRKGIMPPDAERASAQRQTLARGVLLETATLVGAGEDTAKAAEIFKTLPVQVPRAVFLLGLADSLVEQSTIFDRRRLNEPDKKKILLDLAAGCVKPAAESANEDWKKQAKELDGRIEKERKTLPKSMQASLAVPAPRPESG